MDATTEFVATKFVNEGYNLQSYVVAGASKVAHTTAITYVYTDFITCFDSEAGRHGLSEPSIRRE